MPTIYDLPLDWENMFHSHTKQQVKLNFSFGFWRLGMVISTSHKKKEEEEDLTKCYTEPQNWGSAEHGNETLGSIKVSEFIDW
jgi:hypothetical protein